MYKFESAFEAVFSKYQSDKIIYKNSYEDALSDNRGEIKLVFEIGVFKGESIRAFRDYFFGALIVGIDIRPETFFEGDRIKIEIGNACDNDFIVKLLGKYGRPDIVIDDGSHTSADIKALFSLLWKHVNFCYVIEDLDTQYLGFKGHAVPPGHFINDGEPATAIIHKKIDDLLLRVGDCKTIKIYRSICFLFKEQNETNS